MRHDLFMSGSVDEVADKLPDAHHAMSSQGENGETIVRQFVAQVTALKKAKALDLDCAIKWRPLQRGHGVWAATVFATFEVSMNCHACGWEIETSNLIENGACDSIEDGKAKIETWYRDRLIMELSQLAVGARHAD